MQEKVYGEKELERDTISSVEIKILKATMKDHHHRSVLLQEVGKQQRAAWKIILHRGRKPKVEASNTVFQSTSVNNQSTLSNQTSHQVFSNPTEYDDSIPSHPTGDQSILSLTRGTETIPNQQSSNQSIASHPTSDQTVASNEQSHIISEPENDTEACVYVPENDETDVIVEFTNTGTSESVAFIQSDQPGYTCYRTTHAMQIAKVIGHTPDLAIFDKLRSQMKSKRLKSHEEYTKHNKLLAALQKAILTERSSLMESISHIKHSYFQQQSLEYHSC